MTDSDQSTHSPAFDPLDDAGRLLLGLVHQAGSAARDTTEKAFAAARKLTIQIGVAEGRIKALEEDVRRYREAALRAKLQDALLGETELQLRERIEQIDALHRKFADVSARLTATETEKHNIKSALQQKELEAAKLASLFLQFVECVRVLVGKIDADKITSGGRLQDKNAATDWSRWHPSAGAEEQPTTPWKW
jgi:hypothetical protein